MEWNTALEDWQNVGYQPSGAAALRAGNAPLLTLERHAPHSEAAAAWRDGQKPYRIVCGLERGIVRNPVFQICVVIGFAPGCYV